jgi:hypothetical protein
VKLVPRRICLETYTSSEVTGLCANTQTPGGSRKLMIFIPFHSLHRENSKQFPPQENSQRFVLFGGRVEKAGTYNRALSSLTAISLTFFNSVPFIPKYVPICTIWPELTKSLGSEQNFWRLGSNSRQVIPFGILRPSIHCPSWRCCKQNSQIIIRDFLRYERKSSKTGNGHSQCRQ